MLTGKIEQIECTSKSGMGIEEKCTCCRCRSRNDAIIKYAELGAESISANDLSPFAEDVGNTECAENKVTEGDCPHYDCVTCDLYVVCNLPEKGDY
jgi:hypothetical protein